MSDPSPGEVGGIFAGAIALLIAIGHGLRWLLGWEERRDRTRHAKLDAWQAQLSDREAKVDAEIEAQHRETQNEFHALKAQRERELKENAALFTAHQLLYSRLRLCDPNDQALSMSDELLRIAFRPDPNTPVDIESLSAKAWTALDGAG